MPRRPLDLPTHAAVLADLQQLQRGYTPGGKWSLTQCCQHLHLFMFGSLEGFSFRFPWIIRGTLGPLILKRTLKTRRIPAGIPAPKFLRPQIAPYLPDQSPQDDPAVQEVFVATLNRVFTHAGPFHPSPLFGEMTPEQWRQIHLIHTAHHFSFLLPKG